MQLNSGTLRGVLCLMFFGSLSIAACSANSGESSASAKTSPGTSTISENITVSSFGIQTGAGKDNSLSKRQDSIPLKEYSSTAIGLVPKQVTEQEPFPPSTTPTRLAPSESYTEELRIKALYAVAPSERIEALNSVARIGDDRQAISIGTKALADPLPDVRLVALGLLENYVDSLPITTITHLALNDNAPEVRKQALWLLTFAGESTAGETLEVSKNDPNAEVRQMAQDLLHVIDP